MATHKNIAQSGMFVVKLSEMNVIPGVEFVLWKHILLKQIFAFVNCVWKFGG